jgi:hypothetical protein
MYFLKHSYLLLILLVNYISSDQALIIETNELISNDCLIHNIHYKFEYLFASNDVDPAHYYERNAYTTRLNKAVSFDSLRWKFIPVMNNQSDTFYIYNTKYGEYLCASNAYKDIFKKRRKLHTFSIIDKQQLNESSECQWKMVKISESGEPNVYTIWNVLFKEPLYAASYFLKFQSSKRSIFLWYKSPDTDQFNWQIDCKTGEYHTNK